MKILSGAGLKWIAIITMLIDHSAKAILYIGYLKPRLPLTRGTALFDLYEFYRILRGVGRIAFRPPSYRSAVKKSYHRPRGSATSVSPPPR